MDQFTYLIYQFLRFRFIKILTNVLYIEFQCLLRINMYYDCIQYVYQRVCLKGATIHGLRKQLKAHTHHKHAISCQYWACTGIVLATNGMFTVFMS